MNASPEMNSSSEMYSSPDKTAPEGRGARIAAGGPLSRPGPGTLLERVAHAGAGCETTSRDHPDRVALSVAALTADVNALADRARSWAGEPDVFLWFMEQLADLGVQKAAVFEALRSAAPQAVAPLRGALVAAGGRALRDAQDAGRVRADLEPGDIPTIAGLLGAGLGEDLAGRHAVNARTRDVILGGLRTRV